jgi:prepilin-type N-terminal cleavage/methylation domain-containing protein
MKNNEQGFTLLELLIVMGIIAILAVAMSVAFLGSSKTARDTARKADLRSISNNAEQYFKDHGGYPAALTDLTAGGYMSKLPTDPKTKANYTFAVTPVGCAAGACTTYTVTTTLENTNDKQGDPTTHAYTVQNSQ